MRRSDFSREFRSRKRRRSFLFLTPVIFQRFSSVSSGFPQGSSNRGDIHSMRSEKIPFPCRGGSLPGFLIREGMGGKELFSPLEKTLFSRPESFFFPPPPGKRPDSGRRIRHFLALFPSGNRLLIRMVQNQNVQPAREERRAYP